MYNKLRVSPRQYGMTLLEILVSVVLLAIGLLGIASMLMIANKANNSSYAKLQAVQSVYTIFDRIRTNAQAAINGNYNISNIGSNGLPTSVPTPSVLCTTTTCTPSQMATYDTWYWLTKDVSKLPNGSGSITAAPSGSAGTTVITVTVQWDDSQAQNELGAASAASSNPNFVRLSIQSQL
ncbi:type IV pilus modification protein PilV [Legionella worsleiensis]|uniref:Type IV fimbrial biogenesis protein PilV n=1 Tax=Legionella worsleiensis TaxID=45076 RepID=A0A0W1A461_9GAMM|nr:type IV pilus modification protein PilV [Legionella worsleiensis]KTD75795.1 type IV fimbrial biogenesis protein PilV [Legionella worsleiensis]STY32813.1 type IV fimbrial biogenesis protein PilV [Legionella worsleiensis]